MAQGCSRPVLLSLVAILFLSSFAAPGFAAAPGPSPSPAPSAPAHAPIDIEGNAGFNATNGVVGGTGTATDPYRIEGWDITPLGVDGVHLRNTTAYATLRNLTIRGQDPAHVDVFLWGASNVTVENVSATGSAQGIYLYVASRVTVRSCSAPYHDGGSVSLEQSANVLVDGNDGGYAHWGVSVRNSAAVTVTNNRIANVTQGIDVEASTGVLVSGNRVVNGSSLGFSPAGIFVAGSGGTAISGNDVAGLPSVGIHVENSAGITMQANNLTENAVGAALLNATGVVTHNRFVYNVVQSQDTLGNPWDAGYPLGGNYWSDYDGVDRCRGPAQNDCTGTDGIGDTPYVVGGVVRDAYPLMFTDLPPRAAIEAPADVLAGRGVPFRALLVHDSSAMVASVAWDFGDGSTGSGETTSHVYAASGTFSVHVTVTDNRTRTATASATIAVWPAVTFVIVSHPSGFRVPVPFDWETHTDYAVGGTTIPVASLGPIASAFRTNLLVVYQDDSGAQETAAYLSNVVNSTLAGVQKQQPGAHLLGGLAYLTVSGHAAVSFTIASFGAGYLQRAVVVASAAHGRDWLLILSSALPGGQMNATLDAVAAGFEITALPTWAVVVIVGAAGGAVAALVVFAVIKIRKKRASMPHAARPPLAPGSAPAVVCAGCGQPLPAADEFCGKCGTRRGQALSAPPTSPAEEPLHAEGKPPPP